MKRDYLEAEKLAENLHMSLQEEGGMVKENHYPFPGPGRASSGQSYYYFRPNVPTQFHTLDCDEYWIYHAGRDLEAWIIDPEGNLEVRRFGTSPGADLCIYLKQGVAFAAKPIGTDDTGTLISAVTVPRFSDAGLHLQSKEDILRLCPAAKAFFDD